MTDLEKLSKLKEEYNSIEIPKELDDIIKNTIKNEKKNHWKCYSGMAAAVIMALFIFSVNINSAFADNLSEIPVVGSIIKLVTIKTYIYNDKNNEAEINVAEINSTGNSELEKKLNNEFIAEGQKEYSNFLNEMEELKGEGHKGLYTDYEVKTDNDSVFSIVYTKTEISASSDVQYKTYTIDKKNMSVVSLKSLFKNDSYIDVISNYIKSEMKKQMAADESVVYFINDKDLTDANFESIKADQTFYINNKGKLVIMFNKYEVSPGYMGTPEFEIPTEIIMDIILDRGLLK